MTEKQGVAGPVLALLNAAVVAVLALAVCADAAPVAAPAAATRLGNPASQNCIDKGGQLTIEKDAQGGEYGLCHFPGNRQCEEWAMLRGECPVGGRKIVAPAGAVTPPPAAAPAAPAAAPRSPGPAQP